MLTAALLHAVPPDKESHRRAPSADRRVSKENVARWHQVLSCHPENPGSSPNNGNCKTWREASVAQGSPALPAALIKMNQRWLCLGGEIHSVQRAGVIPTGSNLGPLELSA